MDVPLFWQITGLEAVLNYLIKLKNDKSLSSKK